MIFFKQASVQWKLDDWSFKRRLTIGGIQISKGRRLVRFEFEARKGTIGWIQISEGLRLVGFTIPLFVPRLQRSSGKTAGKKGGKLSPFHFRFMTSGDATSGDATSGRACAHDHFRHHHTAPPQIRFELSPYTTGKSMTFGKISSF